MKQIVQDLKTGQVTLVELPTPAVGSGKVLVKVSKSLISLGTEKMMLNFGKGGWISKARQQPDKVKMVFDKIKTDGLMPTVDTVLNKLSAPMPLGYSNVGEVIAIGSGVKNIKVGSRVITNGNHAEVVSIPENLCAVVPDGVSDEEAVFTVVASIALQGVRLVSPTLGENVAVVGLGLIGLITVQLLQANGCNVIGFDFDEKKVEMAKCFGANAYRATDPIEVEKIVKDLTNENGVDAVIITASTSSNAPIEAAPNMCRQKGRVVLVGVVGLELNRTDFFKKEISFQVSCSYGPGRYDSGYEQSGNDYPIGYVRWTENRNFQAVLDLLKTKKLKFRQLITRFEDFSNSPQLYTDITDGAEELGIILNYPKEINLKLTKIEMNKSTPNRSKAVIGIIGAGGFTCGTILPAINKSGNRIKYISSSSGLSSNNAAKKFGAEINTTDYKVILADDEVNTVLITTPHNSHGKLVLESLKAGKNVFVEKPLALNIEEISEIENYYKDNSNPKKLCVGFNRRFSPLTTKLKKSLENCPGPKAVIYTVNSGYIPEEHWVQDPKIGGLRLIGEGCHFLDYIRYIVGKEVVDSSIVFADTKTKDIFTVTLKFSDGSIGTVHYFSNGNKSFSKERVEVFASGNICVLDNFRKLEITDTKGKKKVDKLGSQDKGHSHEVARFLESIDSGGGNIIPLDEIFEISRLAINLDNLS